MADIEDMHSRISAALQRIGAASEGLAACNSAALEAELDAVKQSLEEEKLTTAQLEERVRGLKEHHAVELADARRVGEGQSSAMSQMDGELQRLRKACEQLRENNRALREAHEAGVAEPHLINKAMLAELEALRAERAADVAEATAILSALEPVIAQGGHG